MMKHKGKQKALRLGAALLNLGAVLCGLCSVAACIGAAVCAAMALMTNGSAWPVVLCLAGLVSGYWLADAFSELAGLAADDAALAGAESEKDGKERQE